MIPPAAPLPAPAPASDLPAAPAAPAANLSAFDPSLGASSQAAAEGAALSNPAAIGQRMMGTLNGFQGDLAKMQHLTGSMTTDASTAPATPAAAEGGSKPMLGLVVQTFNFAIETELVTRAATQFTGSVGTLMKGQ